MAYRQKMGMKASKRKFTKSALRVKSKNYTPMISRGGYRL